MELTTINPRYVFVSATEPDDKTAGKLWYNTSENKLYVSDGSSYATMEADTEQLNYLINEQALNILELQATQGLTDEQDYYMVRDIFSDVNGFKNTIDTGNTNATFTAKTTSEGHGKTLNQVGAKTTKNGVKVTIGATDLYIHTLTKSSNSNTTRGYILNQDMSIKASGSFSGNICTFDVPVLCKSGVTYYFCADANGSSVNNSYVVSISFPLNGTALNFVYGMWDGVDSNNVIGNIEGFTYTASNFSMSKKYVNGGSDKIIQTNELTLDFSPSSFYVYALNPTTDGTGTINLDISFNSGTNYQTGIELNTETEIVNTGEGLICKLNLNAGASSGNASCDGYAIMFW